MCLSTADVERGRSEGWLLARSFARDALPWVTLAAGALALLSLRIARSSRPRGKRPEPQT